MSTYDPATVEVKIDGEPLGFDGDYVANVYFKGLEGTLTVSVLSSYITHTHDGSKHSHRLNADGSLGPVIRKLS